MKVELDGGLCEGSGFCALVAPALFDDSGPPPTVALVTDVPPHEEPNAREAQRMCPVRAITVLE